ncbi:serine/threonine protein kinase [Anopheles sinensis]|uniref:Serine/threonine protein kinase n=1 Tax=Anopheles sinensis TaxID=74873 RepID=A0A084WSP0_ANOSI|nr:serine/threonine protein kinase [Anopheles sinensis]
MARLGSNVEPSAHCLSNDGKTKQSANPQSSTDGGRYNSASTSPTRDDNEREIVVIEHAFAFVSLEKDELMRIDDLRSVSGHKDDTEAPRCATLWLAAQQQPRPRLNRCRWLSDHPMAVTPRRSIGANLPPYAGLPSPVRHFPYPVGKRRAHNRFRCESPPGHRQEFRGCSTCRSNRLAGGSSPVQTSPPHVDYSPDVGLSKFKVGLMRARVSYL